MVAGSWDAMVNLLPSNNEWKGPLAKESAERVLANEAILHLAIFTDSKKSTLKYWKKGNLAQGQVWHYQHISGSHGVLIRPVAGDLAVKVMTKPLHDGGCQVTGTLVSGREAYRA